MEYAEGGGGGGSTDSYQILSPRLGPHCTLPRVVFVCSRLFRVCMIEVCVAVCLKDSRRNEMKVQPLESKNPGSSAIAELWLLGLPTLYV